MYLVGLDAGEACLRRLLPGRHLPRAVRRRRRLPRESGAVAADAAEVVRPHARPGRVCGDAGRRRGGRGSA
eukprot:9479657-Pyramimonas_sp.AAC.1